MQPEAAAAAVVVPSESQKLNTSFADQKYPPSTARVGVSVITVDDVCSRCMWAGNAARGGNVLHGHTTVWKKNHCICLKEQNRAKTVIISVKYNKDNECNRAEFDSLFHDCPIVAKLPHYV